MMRRSRYSPLLLLLGLLAASRTLADIPFPQTSIVPASITIVGRDGVGAADPAGAFTVVLRHADGRPYIYHAYVFLDFSQCPDIRLCTDQGDPNVSTDCANRGVWAYSDDNGEVTFRVIGCANNTGASPGSPDSCMRVFADGILLRQVRVAALDQGGCDGLNPGDLSAWLADYFSGQMFARSDFDGDGVLTPNDLSLWLAAFFGGASALGCVGAACP